MCENALKNSPFAMPCATARSVAIDLIPDAFTALMEGSITAMPAHIVAWLGFDQSRKLRPHAMLAIVVNARRPNFPIRPEAMRPPSAWATLHRRVDQ